MAEGNIQGQEQAATTRARCNYKSKLQLQEQAAATTVHCGLDLFERQVVIKRVAEGHVQGQE